MSEKWKNSSARTTLHQLKRLDGLKDNIILIAFELDSSNIAARFWGENIYTHFHAKKKGKKRGGSQFSRIDTDESRLGGIIGLHLGVNRGGSSSTENERGELEGRLAAEINLWRKEAGG